MKKVILLGPLRKLHPEPFYVDAKTAAEAVKAFSLQTGCLRPVPGKDPIVSQVVGFDTLEALNSPTDVEEICLVPAFIGGGGGGNSGFVKIVIGAALIAASFAIPPGMAIAGVALQSIAFSMGASMVLGGLMELISPAPKLDTQLANMAPDPEASRYLGAPRNTTRIGTRIPVILGEVKHGGHYLSFNINAKDVAV